MTTIKDLIAQKGGQVFSIGRDATVLDAARLMNEHKIGALVVLESRRIIGIFTERDVLRRVVAERRDPADVRIEEVMTAEVACCRADTPIDEARSVMKNRRIRHLPVIDENHNVLGLISIGDLNAQLSGAQEQTIYFLTEYLYGRV